MHRSSQVGGMGKGAHRKIGVYVLFDKDTIEPERDESQAA